MADVPPSPQAGRARTDTLNTGDNTRIADIRPLLPPACLMEDLPLDVASSHVVQTARKAVSKVMRGESDRLLVVVGPCSIHDVKAAMEYAARLKNAASNLKEDLLIVMRVYFEKPRTTVGWKGLINDPDLDGTFDINKGLRMSRELLLDINRLGLPCGTEFLDSISPQYYADLISWGAIGARTTESQVHRELASGLSMPVGFKNGTSGNTQIAVDAILSSTSSHNFISVSKQSLGGIVLTNGNPDCHIILRGGADGPNYSKEHCDEASARAIKGGVMPRLVVDCSHGNSRKIHTNQPIVAAELAARIADSDETIFGVMLESHLLAGAQKIGEHMTYGMSVTDACMDWSTTEVVLNNLAAAVRARREKRAAAPSGSPVSSYGDLAALGKTPVNTDDLRIRAIKPLMPPACIIENLELDAQTERQISSSRHAISQIYKGRDDRLCVIVGPCSVHDVKAAKEYAALLQPLMQKLKEDLLIVMRVYFEKPRTTVGWKGLINDPDLDGSFKINKGLQLARELLLHVCRLGLPCGTEFLDAITPQYTADLISWGAIGARTTESQVHRELASGLSMPVGFKNGTSGNCQIAVDAVRASAMPHTFLSVSKEGIASVVHSSGNEDCHVILRGGRDGPNYADEHVSGCNALLAKHSLTERLIVDCSHANSKKLHTNQPIVAADLAGRIAEGDESVFGVMLESFLVAGNQKITDRMTYGQSITDACMDWETTVTVCENLAAAVRARRALKGK